MKILNLYAGIGGNRWLWGDEHEITAIENNKEIAKEYKKNFPNDRVIICDAHQYLLDHYEDYDFIWSSPPCPTHSKFRLMHPNKVPYPDMTLYQEIILLTKWFKGKWVIENVIPYYEPLIQGQKVGRHLFWSNFKISHLDISVFNIKYKTKEELAKHYGMKVTNVKYLRNCVNPQVGLHILNCE